MSHPIPTLDLRLDTAQLPSPSLPDLLGLVRAAEDAGVTSVTLSDTLTGGGVRLDSLVAASALGPVTARIGLIPEVVSAVTEPFHTATALQTIDHASLGRAGLALRPGLDAAEHATQGRWPRRDITAEAVHDDAEDTLEAIARLWESWQDDAVIRDVATDRFLDRTRIHDAAFVGSRFSIEGASITPRSPQGRPPVVLAVPASAGAGEVPDDQWSALVAARADVAVVPGVDAEAAAWLRGLGSRSRWATDDLLVWGEVPLGVDTDVAALRRAAVEAGLDGLRLVLAPELHAPSAVVSVLGTEPAGERTTLREALGLTAATNPYSVQEASLV